MVIAGEISGDAHLAKVLAEVKRQDDAVELWGIGGDACQAVGVEVLVHVREMSVLGLYEVLKRYGFFKRVFAEMLAAVKQRQPDAVLLVDYPGFNLRFAKQLHGMGINVIYYICPQVWAWHRSRIGKMAKIIDQLLVIFPFEKDLFAGTGLSVEYVGHPLLDAGAVPATAAGVLPEGDFVALLPGSREQEVQRNLPVLLEAAQTLEPQKDGIAFVVAAASEKIAASIKRVMSAQGARPKNIRVVCEQTNAVLRAARAAWVASGTATLETALQRCPMVIVYKTSWLTYEIGRRLIRVPHLGMVNLIAEKEICPEFIQHEATAQNLVEAMLPLLAETSERDTMLRELDAVVEKLGPAGAAARAAEHVLGVLSS